MNYRFLGDAVDRKNLFVCLFQLNRMQNDHCCYFGSKDEKTNTVFHNHNGVP